MPLSVIGAGFGRTGTLSLQSALESLGIRRCYHMLEVRKNPEHIDLWSAAAAGDEIDWEGLFDGYQAAVDWPACHFWRQLGQLYPDAKVILTVRDPERWYDSVANTIYRSMIGDAGPGDELTAKRRIMARDIILERTFNGRFEDRAYAIGVFKQHRDEVEKTISPGRLLVYEVAEGWGPLCRFLGRPVPETEFPQVNSTEEFQSKMGLLPE